MANNNISSLNLVDLDFFSLKNSLRNFLKSQDQFKDYDFEGPNLAVLIDLLAYNTHKNAFFINMALSESFIDSAQLRSSVVSHAKELNYLPRSARSAESKVKITFDASGESAPYIIPKGSPFSTLIKNDSYTFTLPETTIVTSANNTYELETTIYEGIYLQDVYITDATTVDTHQRFIITNKNVDTRSISVTVYEDGAEVGDIYTASTSLLGLKKTSKVFFIQMTEGNYYEIIFGNNILGKKPQSNARIIIDYRITVGSAANGAKSFSVDFDPTSSGELITTPELEVLEVAKNGNEEENIEDIRYYAPRHFQVQERTVVSTDYEIALKTQFPEINVVSVYGGEEANPPRYGKVFIAVDISNVDGLPESRKTAYYNFLTTRSMLTVQPIFIEPEYTYVDIISIVRFNINLTTKSSSRIKTLVNSVIDNYNNKNLNDFNSTLRFSKLSTDIDNSDISIISNSTTLKIFKKLEPTLGISQNIVVKFDIELKDSYPLHPNTMKSNEETCISSSEFKYNGETCKIIDDGNGILRIVKIENSTLTKVLNIGTVNYKTGELLINSFKPDSYEGNWLKLYAITNDKDIKTNKNTILKIEPADVTLKIEEISE